MASTGLLSSKSDYNIYQQNIYLNQKIVEQEQEITYLINTSQIKDTTLLTINNYFKDFFTSKQHLDLIATHFHSSPPVDENG